ncbi:MAG: hypothetical protein WBH08_03845 [Methanothrix sp.]|uniref:hypothetical protein n=1 Tax=Methanothrix sp. TaxID=90426 RepID=UPI003BB4E03C
MQFEITKIDVAGGLVRGLVRSGGRDLKKVAEHYMEAPNKSCPYAGGSGGLCPVESWIAKTRGEVPGGDAGDWGLVFSIRDPALLAGIRDGTHSIEIRKSSTDAIDFDVSKSIKYTKVNKNMSTDIEMFNELVEERMNEIRKSASGPKDLRVLKAVATAEISRERPDLTRAVLLAEKIESTMPPKQTVAKAAPQEPLGPAARELDRLVKSRMAEIRKSAGSAAASSERILEAMATSAICKEEPGLMRAVLNEERHVEARLAYGGRF